MTDQRRLTSHRGPCRLNAAEGFLGDGRLQLPGMGVVHHDRDVATGIGNAFEQPERIVGVRIRDEAGRPVGGRFGADANTQDVIQCRIQ